jgi:hypothetical protein
MKEFFRGASIISSISPIASKFFGRSVGAARCALLEKKIKKKEEKNRKFE